MTRGRWLQAAVVAAALVCGLAPISPQTVESVFSTGIYPRIQRLLTPLSNAVAFALQAVLRASLGGLGLSLS